MRIHNIIKTVCLAGSLALLSACEDWLEIEPKDRFGDTTVWGSEENADMFLNDIYNQLPHLNNETQNLDQYSDNSYVGAEWMNARTTIYTGALSPTSWIPGPWDMWKWGRQNNENPISRQIIRKNVLQKRVSCVPGSIIISGWRTVVCLSLRKCWIIT